jgi:curved DNA-binding protein CbpA
MTRDDLKKYFEVLELSPDASLRDVKNAYLRLKKVYSGDSIVLAPLAEEFSEKKRKKILQQLEGAYAKLSAAFKDKPPAATLRFADQVDTEGTTPEEEIIAHRNFSGPILKEIREKMGVELSEISKQLKLRVELLKNFEEETYAALPEEIYLKVHLKNYATCLHLNPTKVVDDYLVRYLAWKGQKK